MSETATPAPSEDLWLFGYGSLIWKPPPHFDRRVPGYIEGYVRRFWQASEDHRGTPESPGRVVTLIERSYWETLGEESLETHNRVYGAAYHIPPSYVQAVKAYLDIREINGYSIQYTDCYPMSSAQSTDASPITNCMVYIGLPSNPQFLGRESPEDVAGVIAASHGPSGANAEYLFMLEESLASLGEENGDCHIKDLATRVRLLLANLNANAKIGGEHGGAMEGEMRISEAGLAYAAVERELERVRSGEGGKPDEEAEKVVSSNP